jgi:antitoxin VapB
MAAFSTEGTMGAQLNIKSDDAYRLAADLAALTGESLTAAVTAALRERLERARRGRDLDERKRRLRALAAEIRAHMSEPVSSDHGWLYDENGLPR